MHFFHTHWWATFVAIGYILSWAIIPFVLLANKPPVSTLNWIWVLLLFPWLGPLVYFLVGSDHLARKHLNMRQEMEGTGLDERLAQHRAATGKVIENLEDGEQTVAKLLASINENPASVVTGAKLLVDAQTFYPALLEAIAQAKLFVHVEFFIFREDKYGEEMRDALAIAARRGVQVRLLCDQMGCFGVRESFFQPIRDAGGKFAWFRTVHPTQNRWVFNLRNHRKIQIIDGHISFVGGMNIGREYMGEDPKSGSWRDVQVRLEGQVAAVLQRVFADDWYYATEEKIIDRCYYPLLGDPPHFLAQVIDDGPDNPEDPIQMSIVALLNSAKQRAWLTAGYFVPNEPLITALKVCASRGVDTRLLISAKSDHPYLVQVGRSYYEPLLEFGVRLFEYEKGINHAKVATFDCNWMMVGSANFDNRSMRLNFELNVLLNDEKSVTELDRVLLADYEQNSTEIKLEEFRQRAWTQRALESLFRPLAPLL